MRNRQSLVVAVLLACLVLSVFGGVSGHSFIDEHDDALYVTANPHVRQGLSWQGASWAFFSAGYAANWHPLTWLSHMMDVRFFGLNAGRHHLVNLLLHLCNVLLLFRVLTVMTGNLWRSALVAALFAVHPLNVETVSWVAERKNLLSTGFWFLTLGAYVRYVRRPGIGTYLAVPVLLALGLMAKPMLVTLPFVLLLVDRWPLGRRLDRRAFLEKSPLLVLSVLSGLATLVAQSGSAALTPLARLPVAPRLANVLCGYAAYLEAAVWPANLSFFYPRTCETLLAPEVLVSLSVLAVFSVAVWMMARKAPSLSFGWLWYLGTLAPVAGFLQSGAQARADRYAYVTLIGIFVMVAWAMPELLRRLTFRVPVAASLAVAIVAGLAFVARADVAHWRDGGTLFRHALRVNPGNWVAENYLGAYLFSHGQPDQALDHLRRAVAIKPNYTDGMFNLAGVLVHRGQVAEAEALYRHIVVLRPQDQDAHFNLGSVLLQQGRAAEAVPYLKEAVRLKPEDADARANLEQARRRQGDAAARGR